MAAITSIITVGPAAKRIRTITASAAATADAVAVPTWAKYCRITFRATTVTTNTLFNVQGVTWGATAGTYDDATAFNIAEHTAFTAQTGASILAVQIGPGVTGIADDVTNAAAANSQVSLNAVLPQVLYITTTNTGALTATIDIEFRG